MLLAMKEAGLKPDEALLCVFFFGGSGFRVYACGLSDSLEATTWRLDYRIITNWRQSTILSVESPRHCKDLGLGGGFEGSGFRVYGWFRVFFWVQDVGVRGFGRVSDVGGRRFGAFGLRWFQDLVEFKGSGGFPLRFRTFCGFNRAFVVWEVGVEDFGVNGFGVQRSGFLGCRLVGC